MSGGNYNQQPGGYPPQPGMQQQPPAGYPQQQPGYPPQGYAQPYGQAPMPGQYVAGFVQPAGLPTEAFGGFWIRLLSYIIDWFVLLVPTGIIGLVFGFGALSMSEANSMGAAQGTNAAGNMVSLAVTWAYFAVMEVKFGGTLGKLALGLRVVDDNGNYLSFGRATGRYFSKILSACTLLIGFIMAGFHEKKRSLHDLIAGTYVVRKEFVNPSQMQQR